MRVGRSDEHHRNEVLRGLGDTRVSVRHFFVARKELQIAAVAGLSLPLGGTNTITRESFIDEHEAEQLGIEVPRHTHLQLGSGTVDPVIGIDAVYRFAGRWIFYTNVNAKLPFYSNSFGYRTGASVSASFGPGARFGSTASVNLLFSVHYSGRDRLHAEDVIAGGTTISGDFAVPNTGRLELGIRPGLVVPFSKTATLNIGVNVPLHTQIRTGSVSGDVQLFEPAGLFFSISWDL